jgi:hypothetical protein
LFLSKAERDFLRQKGVISKNQQRYIRYKLRRKIKHFCNSELPLLIDQGYITPDVAANSYGVAASSHDGGAIRITPIRDVNIMFESEAHTERGSPSLVGRGIANPMSERTRGFEMLSSLRR